ncbi:hypothetical protein C923_01798 [Plasmodium falciparum UGT5.1]|uniref:Erythrocyte membrane protein 1 n=1 Tax=Plasmodium falciparum UGT5.1 TaxID=1237627 RepID=W7K0U6_PLAFA|nr:hypothetical protein C923_01798 [Plasmodium falciparum UGT5.1]
MARGGSGGEEDAKNMFDRIGKDVYDEIVKKDTNDFREKLKGNLNTANGHSLERVSSIETCKLVKEYYDGVNGSAARGERYPCGTRKEEVNRFSDKQQAEYDNKKMKCSNGDACAPFRRLHLCNKNMVKMDTNNNDSNAKHKLLAEVCMAAKYEGNSINTHYTPHQEKYKDTGTASQLCTVLARSFADIGDIVRGRDLYGGSKKKNQTEREKLEENLKEIFKQIHDDVTKGGTNAEELKARYKKDEDKNFFKLREDWWTANRSTVWEALTCDARDNAKYFRQTCGTGTGTQGRCRCVTDVPTYFDYVPQYLRWFEEWAEDFCRKRKKQLTDAKKYCRKGEDGTDRYCDLNGYDCKGTFRGINMYRWDHKCTGCFLSCSHFRTWIDNQKEQFLKQKNKYTDEINGVSGIRRRRRDARSSSSSSYDNGYEKKFYEKFKGKFGTVNVFLGLLSKETTCKDQPQDGEKISSINFTNANTDDIFSPTEYCQACPWCGLKDNKDGTWERKDNIEDCPPIKLYRPRSGAEGTPINFLYSGDEEKEIAKNLKAFCKTQIGNGSVPGGASGSKSGSQDLYEEWRCYQPEELTKDDQEGVEDQYYENDVKTGGGLCILPNPKKNEKGKAKKSEPEPKEIQKTFNPFFYYWVVHMLKDSIHWRTEKIKGCLENGTKIRCKNNEKCNKECGCFQKWVQQKKTEWKNIKIHFGKQEGIVLEQGFMKLTHDAVLQTLLKKDLLLKIIQDVHGDTDDIERIGKMLDDDAAAVAAVIFGGENNTTIDKLLDHEENDANKCIEKQEECKQQKKQQQQKPPTAEDPARSLKPPAGRSLDTKPDSASDENGDDDDDHDSSSEEEEDEEDDGVSHVGEEVKEEAEEEKEEDTGSQEDTGQTPAIQDNTEKSVDVCKTVEEALKLDKSLKEACSLKYGSKSHVGWNCNSDIFKPENDGACMPPRRQKLYLKKLQTFNGQKPDDLRKAFIECAAIETFFAWYKYKADKKKEKQEENEEALYGIGGEVISTDEELKKDLENGKIPYEFKRQMFYTFGDYKDIFFGKNIGDDVNEVEKNIKNVFPNSDTPNDQDNKNWWKTYGKDIWEGMLCGLSYASGTEKDKDRTQLTTTYNYKTIKNDLEDFATVPQFLRWFDEWGEEFCRKQKIKIDKIKVSCRGKYGGNKCSAEGYDCEITKLTENKIFKNLLCPSCEKECTNYKKWIKNKNYEFNKQNEKYKKEYKNDKNPGDGRNANNNKMLYDKLKKAHNEDNIFFELLNKGQICKNHYENNEINYNALDQTFSRPEYCESCPLFDLKWKGNERNSFSVASCKKIKLIPNIKTHNKEEATVINILVNDNKKKHISPDLKDDYKDCQVLKNLRKQEWNCKYMCNLDVCELKNFENDIDDEKFMSIEVFIKRWLVYFLTDYSKLKEQLNECMNNENNTCIRDCKNFCKCAEQWITKKKNEWQQIKERYLKQYKSENEDVSYHLKSYLLQNPFTKYVKNALNKNETLEQLQESDGCHNSGKYYKTPCEKKDVITIFIDRLTEKIELYNKQPHEETQENCVPLLSNNPYEPEPHPDDENELEDPFSSTSISSRPDFCPDIQPEPEAPQEPAVPAGGKDDTFNGTQEEEEAAKPGQNDTSNQGPEEEIPALPDGEEVPKEVVPDKEVPVPPQKKTESKKKRPPLKPPTNEYKLTDVLLPTAFPLSVGIAFASLTYLLLKKKTKSTIDLLRIIDIPKGDYDMPTMKSSNRYIPYASHRYKGKTYIYMEGDSGDEKYTFMSDTSDITSSESEYEELDINNIYPYKSPKYKTLIDVILEPSKRDIQSDDTPTNKFTDNEWNVLKNDFITNILQSEQNDIPNNNISANIPLNTHPNTLYFDNPEEKPFITKIHDRNLYSGEEYSYNINMTNNDDIPISDKNDTYSGIDLINDSLNSDQHIDIYDEVLKRKENELFGTNHKKKNTSTNSVAKNTNSDPILNQINLFHKWLDRHRNMCEKLKNKEDILNKLKEEWNKENNNNSAKTYNSDNKPSHNHVLNTDVSIQINMDNPKTKNEITNMDTNPDKSTTDTILDDLEKYNEPYYYDFYEDDIIYHDVDVEKSSMDDIYVDHNNVTSNNMDVPTKMHIEMNIVNNKKKIFEEEYPISDIWNI